ncbi:amidase family protein [Rhizobium leguminosarum]|uniref:amidase family protein n=1 Tax=Rhizobium leguminosarum TaxID=384 RepID=UPI003F9C830C
MIYSAPSRQLRVAASQSELRYARGTARPLEGVPILVGDLIDTKDIETRYGSTIFDRHVPSADAAAVTNILNAGALIIGKTDVPELGWDRGAEASSKSNDTALPTDSLRIANSAAARAIEQGIAPAALVTNIGGAVCSAAAQHGVVGFKPSRSLLPKTGMWQLAPTLDQGAILGATVDDVLKVAMACSPPTEICSIDHFEVATLLDISNIVPGRQVASAFVRAVQKIFPKSPARIAETDFLHGTYSVYQAILQIEAAICIHSHFSDEQLAFASFGFQEAIRRAGALSVSCYASAMSARQYLTAQLDACFAKIDFLLLPVTPIPDSQNGYKSVQIGNWSGTSEEARLTYSVPFCLADLPTISVPLSVPEGGRLVGIQIVAGRGNDWKLLAFAKKAQKAVS